MKMIQTKTLLTAASMPFVLLGLSAEAAPVIYEPFNYSTGVINGTQTGALGTTGSWTQSGGSGLFNVVTPGLTFTGLSTTGGAAQRTSASGGSEISIGIAGAAQAALLADNSTIYFSVLVRNDRFSVANSDLTFVIGTGALVTASDNVNPTITGGEGFGIHLDGLNDDGAGPDTIDIFGYQIDGGAAAESATKINNDTSVNTFMIVGKIDWKANGIDDTLTLYNIADVNAALPTAFATMSADLDQSLFDTLAISDRQILTIDEIRFGTTLADVGVVPEPGSLALLGLGGLLIGARRRRD